MSNGDGDRCVTSVRATASREGDWGARKSVMMRAIASHQRGPGSNSSVDIICGLSLLLAHTTIRPRMVDEETLCGCAISKSSLTWIDADEVCTNFTDVPTFVSWLLFLFLLLSLYFSVLKFYLKKVHSHTSLISRRPSKFLSYLSKISSLISLTLSRATPYPSKENW